MSLNKAGVIDTMSLPVLPQSTDQEGPASQDQPPSEKLFVRIKGLNTDDKEFKTKRKEPPSEKLFIRIRGLDAVNEESSRKRKRNAEVASSSNKNRKTSGDGPVKLKLNMPRRASDGSTLSPPSLGKRSVRQKINLPKRAPQDSTISAPKPSQVVQPGTAKKGAKMKSNDGKGNVENWRTGNPSQTEQQMCRDFLVPSPKTKEPATPPDTTNPPTKRGPKMKKTGGPVTRMNPDTEPQPKKSSSAPSRPATLKGPLVVKQAYDYFLDPIPWKNMPAPAQYLHRDIPYPRKSAPKPNFRSRPIAGLSGDTGPDYFGDGHELACDKYGNHYLVPRASAS